MLASGIPGLGGTLPENLNDLVREAIRNFTGSLHGPESQQTEGRPNVIIRSRLAPPPLAVVPPNETAIGPSGQTNEASSPTSTRSLEAGKANGDSRDRLCEYMPKEPRIW